LVALSATFNSGALLAKVKLACIDGSASVRATEGKERLVQTEKPFAGSFVGEFMVYSEAKEREAFGGGSWTVDGRGVVESGRSVSAGTRSAIGGELLME